MQLLHPIYGVIKSLKEKGLSEAVIFGSAYTMTSTYIKRTFIDEDIRATPPSQKDINTLDELRRNIYSQKSVSTSQEKLEELISTYADKKLVVLACTEFSSIKNRDNYNCIDMAHVQVDAGLSILTI